MYFPSFAETSTAVSLKFWIYVIAGIYCIVFRYLYIVNEKKLARSFYFKFRYNDDVHSLNNSDDRTYHIEPQVKDSTDTDKSASSLDLHLKIDSEGRLITELYDKEMISIFPLRTFHLYVATFQQHIYIWSIYLSDDTIFHSLWLLSCCP